MSIKLFILLSPQTCSWPLSYSALVPALRVPLYSLGAAKTLSSRGAIPGRSRVSSALAAGQRWPPWTPGHKSYRIVSVFSFVHWNKICTNVLPFSWLLLVDFRWKGFKVLCWNDYFALWRRDGLKCKVVWYEIIYLSPEVQRAYAAYWKWNAPRIDYQKFTIQWVWRVYKTFRKDLKKIFFLDIDGVEN